MTGARRRSHEECSVTLDDGQERRDAFEAVASLVQLAVGHEDPARLVAAAAAEVRHPLGLAGSAGEPLGHGPDDEEGRRALAMATAAARQRLVAPPGWQIARLSHGSAVLGFLAVGPRDGDGRASRTLLELMPALLTDQLKRGVLLRAQRAAFVRQLVAEGGLASEQARREGAELGLSMASSYWPALLTWRHAAPPAAVGEAGERQARGLVAGGITVKLDGALAVLHPDGAAGGGAASAWFEAVACPARSLALSTGAPA